MDTDDTEFFELLPRPSDLFSVTVPIGVLATQAVKATIATNFEFTSDYEEWSSFMACCHIHRCSSGTITALPTPAPAGQTKSVSTRSITVVHRNTPTVGQRVTDIMQQFEQETNLSFSAMTAPPGFADSLVEAPDQSTVTAFAGLYTIRNGLLDIHGSPWFQLELRDKANTVLGLARWHTDTPAPCGTEQLCGTRELDICVLHNMQQNDEGSAITVHMKAAVLKVVRPSAGFIDQYQACLCTTGSHATEVAPNRRQLNSIIADYGVAATTEDDKAEGSSGLLALQLTCFLTGESGSFRDCFTGAQSTGRLLTPHNLRNQRRGYDSYLPATLPETEAYWRRNFGFSIYSETVTAANVVLVQLETSFGSRIFPLPTLAFYMCKSEHYTRVRQETILRDSFLPALTESLGLPTALALTVQPRGPQASQAPETALEEDDNKTPKVVKPPNYVTKTGTALKLQLTSAKVLRDREAGHLAPPPPEVCQAEQSTGYGLIGAVAAAMPQTVTMEQTPTTSAVNKAKPNPSAPAKAPPRPVPVPRKPAVAPKRQKLQPPGTPVCNAIGKTSPTTQPAPTLVASPPPSSQNSDDFFDDI